MYFRTNIACRSPMTVSTVQVASAHPNILNSPVLGSGDVVGRVLVVVVDVSPADRVSFDAE